MTETVAPESLTQEEVPGGQHDYWGTDVRTKFFFPDGVTFMEIKVMNEGARAKFQRENNQDMKINRRDDSASIRLDTAKERHALIKASVVGWNLTKNGQIVDFAPSILQNWLEVADPKIVDDLEFACRKANPWLQQDMEVEDIDKEIDRLTELRADKVRENEGKVSSNSN
jgi:hypothetical protein